jgi:hypothetical protein
MRLKAENAMAGDEERKKQALAAILKQIGRLDVLLRCLLEYDRTREAKLCSGSETGPRSHVAQPIDVPSEASIGAGIPIGADKNPVVSRICKPFPGSDAYVGRVSFGSRFTKEIELARVHPRPEPRPVVAQQQQKHRHAWQQHARQSVNRVGQKAKSGAPGVSTNAVVSTTRPP